MLIELYCFLGDSRLVTKLSSFEAVASLSSLSLNGTLREPTDILNPSIDINVTQSSNEESFVQHANYVYIPSFNNRYYFIEEKTILQKGIYRLSLRVDVLQSYDNDIRSLTCMVTRNEYSFNEMLEDELIPFTNEKVYIDEPVSNMYPLPTGVTTTDFTWDSIDYNIVLSTFALDPNHATIGSTTIDAPWEKNNIFKDIDSAVINPLGRNKRYYAINALSAENLAELCLRQYEDYGSNVVNMIAFPFVVKDTASYSSIFIGSHEIQTEQQGSGQIYVSAYEPIGGNSGYSGYILHRFFHMGAVSRFYGNESNDAVTKYGTRPYMKLEFYIPYIGFVEINPQWVSDKDIAVFYVVNYETGSATAYVTAGDYTLPRYHRKTKLIYTGECMLGRSLGISVSNMEKNASLRASNGISTTISALTSALMLGVGASTGNAGLMISGGTGLAGSIGKGIATEGTILDSTSVKFSGEGLGAFAMQDFRIRYTLLKSSLPDSELADFAKEHGRPLKEVYTLSALTGMTLCEKPVLDTIHYATSTEKDMISSLLQTGIIL